MTNQRTPRIAVKELSAGASTTHVVNKPLLHAGSSSCTTCSVGFVRR
jgi:xanthine dehydrogenase iron-sulfur cluster and FAD-binding subunit A